MKKIILFLTLIILCFSISCCVYFAYKCANNDIKDIENVIKIIDKNIKKIDKDIVNSEKKLSDLKNNNEKGELLDLWQRSLELIKKDS